MANGPLGFALAADAGERLVFGTVTVFIRASAETTCGAFTVIEEVPPMVDTPPHVHAREDEMFYVLEGEHVVRCGDEEFRLGPGGVVFLPRGIPHSQRRVVPGEGRLLVLTSPAGFEGFFRQLAAAECEEMLGPDAYAEASENYGITWLDLYRARSSAHRLTALSTRGIPAVPLSPPPVSEPTRPTKENRNGEDRRKRKHVARRGHPGPDR